MIRFFLTTLLLFTVIISQAQKNSYREVDSIMRNFSQKIKDENDLHKLSFFIRTRFEPDSLRFRAAFIWITENIAYDVKAYENDDPRAARVDYALKNKRAICGGYAKLVLRFCEFFAIECKIISGYARAGKKGIAVRNPKVVDKHGWNMVKINGTWRLVDATWAAGNVDDDDQPKRKFHKGFNEIYYFPSHEKLKLTHLPDIREYQLVRKPIDQKTFWDSPLFCTDFLVDSISSVLPAGPQLNGRKGDTLTFRLQTSCKDDFYFIKTDKEGLDTYYTRAEIVNGWSIIKYPITVSGSYTLYLGRWINSSNWNYLLGYKGQFTAN